MSNLATALKTMLARHQMKPAELARLSHVAEPKISRWLGGTQTFISDNDLSALANHLAADRAEKAELVVARMRDVCSGPGSELIQVSIGGKVVREDPALFGKKLSPKMEEAVRAVIENADDPDVRNLVLCIGNLLRKGTARIE